MKLLLIFLLLLNAAAYAQPKLMGGIEAGAGFVTLSGNDIVEDVNNTATRLTGGVFLQYNFRSSIELKEKMKKEPSHFYLSLKSGISYEDKGSRSSTIIFTDPLGNSLGTGRLHTHLKYITIPVLLKATVGSRVQYFLNAGPYAGFLLNASSVFKGGSADDYKIKNTDQFKGTDFGISAGLGIQFPLNNVHISIEARNNFGLANISETDVVDDGSIRTNAFNILVGLGWEL